MQPAKHPWQLLAPCCLKNLPPGRCNLEAAQGICSAGSVPEKDMETCSLSTRSQNYPDRWIMQIEWSKSRPCDHCLEVLAQAALDRCLSYMDGMKTHVLPTESGYLSPAVMFLLLVKRTLKTSCMWSQKLFTSRGGKLGHTKDTAGRSQGLL